MSDWAEKCDRCGLPASLQTIVLRLDPDPTVISEAVRLCGLCCSVLLQEFLNAMRPSTLKAWKEGRCDLVIYERPILVEKRR